MKEIKTLKLIYTYTDGTQKEILLDAEKSYFYEMHDKDETTLIYAEDTAEQITQKQAPFTQPDKDYFENFTAYDIFTKKPVKMNLRKAIQNSKTLRLPTAEEIKSISL